MSLNKSSKRILILSAALSMFMASSVYAETVSLDLPDAMQRAFATNPSLGVAAYNYQSAQAKFNAARESYGPSISFGHNFARGGLHTEQVLGTGTGVDHSYSNNASVSMPIFTGGKLEGSVKSAKANYNIAKLGVQQSYNDLRDTVYVGYYTVLQTQNLEKLTAESVTRLEDHLKNVKAQFDVGVVAKVDVLRSEVELADAVQQHLSARNAASVAMSNMNRIIGLPLDTELVLKDSLDYKECAYTLPYCIDYSLKNRPEYEIARQSVEAAKGALIAAKSGHMPQVSANASNRWGGKSGNSWPGNDDSTWGVGIALSMNIFDSGVTWSKIHGAEADLHKAEENYRDTVNLLNLDGRTKYNNLRESEERIKSSKSALAAAEEDYRIAKLRYMNGVGTNTDVLDAQVALTKAQTNHLQAVYDYNTNKVALDNSMGVAMVPPVQFKPPKYEPLEPIKPLKVKTVKR